MPGRDATKRPPGVRNQHDILTDAAADGTLAAGLTCDNRTSSSTGRAMVGHSDRAGLSETVQAKSWNATHASRASGSANAGCSAEALVGMGGWGRIYCFATE